MSRRDTATRVATLRRLLDLYESAHDEAKRSPLAKQAAWLFFSLWSNEGSVLHRPDLADLYLHTWRVLPREALMRWQPDAYPITVYRAATVRDSDGWCWTTDVTAYALFGAKSAQDELREEFTDDGLVHLVQYALEFGCGRIFRRRLYESDIVATHEMRSGGYVARELIAYPTGKMPEALRWQGFIDDDGAWSVPVGHLRLGAKAWGPHATASA